jgi:hypothetical protein
MVSSSDVHLDWESLLGLGSASLQVSPDDWSCLDQNSHTFCLDQGYR